MRTPIALSLALCLSLFPSFASAEEAAPEGEGANKPVYVDLTPALVGNYGSGPRCSTTRPTSPCRWPTRTRRPRSSITSP